MAVEGVALVQEKTLQLRAEGVELQIRLRVWLGQSEKFDWPSVQFDTIMIKFWVAIVENCTENGLGPAVIFSSEVVA